MLLREEPSTPALPRQWGAKRRFGRTRNLSRWRVASVEGVDLVTEAAVEAAAVVEVAIPLTKRLRMS